MVSTRHHPTEFPPPDLSPALVSPSKQVSPSKRASSKRSSPSAASKGAWAHTPSAITLLWLAVSLPLVIWDTGYVMLRPYSMPGGWAHSPIWKLYDLYGTVDYVYGWPAYHERDGFCGAQGTLNLIETVLYFAYLGLVYKYGVQTTAQGVGAPDKSLVGRLGWAREVTGRVAAIAVLIAFSTSVMTISKTVLYWLNEAYSGFKHIGHNDPVSLTFLWILPNGLWLIFPAYMCYVFGSEIISGLEAASSVSSKKTN